MIPACTRAVRTNNLILNIFKRSLCNHTSSEAHASPSHSSQATTLSIFFSNCSALRKIHDVLSSLGFHSLDPVSAPSSSIRGYQTARISCGSLVIELISDPLFSRLRNSYGKRSSFARVIEIKRSQSRTKGPVVPPSGSSVFSGMYPFTALISSFPHNVPMFTVDGEQSPVATDEVHATNNIPQNIPRNSPRHFNNVKEIIIPCSTTDYSIIDTVQSALVETFNAVPLGRRLPGLFQIDLSTGEKLIVRTAPTNVCTIILKVNSLAAASIALASLGALGDCMGHNGTANNGQIQVKLPLDGGVEFRVTDSDVVSSFYAEPPQSVVQDTLPEMQSSRVMMEGGEGRGREQREEGGVKVNPLAATGDCWKEVRVQLRNAAK